MDKELLAMIDGLFPDMPLEDRLIANMASEISVAIREKRLEMGLTQQDFSNMLDVSQGMLSRYETGQENLTIETIAKIFGRLGMDVAISITPYREIMKSKTEWVDKSPTLENPVNETKGVA